jgi:hypothetical protein
MRDDVEASDLCDCVPAGVGFKVRNHNVDAALCYRVGVLQHLKSLANTRSVAQINLQVATLSLSWHGR